MLRSLVHNRDIIAANYNELEKNKILASKNSMTSSFHNFFSNYAYILKDLKKHKVNDAREESDQHPGLLLSPYSPIRFGNRQI